MQASAAAVALSNLRQQYQQQQHAVATLGKLLGLFCCALFSKEPCSKIEKTAFLSLFRASFAWCPLDTKCSFSLSSIAVHGDLMPSRPESHSLVALQCVPAAAATTACRVCVSMNVFRCWSWALANCQLHNVALNVCVYVCVPLE